MNVIYKSIHSIYEMSIIDGLLDIYSFSIKTNAL